jgi:hypothetical protein
LIHAAFETGYDAAIARVRPTTDALLAACEVAEAALDEHGFYPELTAKLRAAIGKARGEETTK